MIKVDRIIENEKVLSYLFKRNLMKQYDKKKKQILAGFPELADFKLREPKELGIYYFRINKQFRVLGKFRNNNVFAVFKIDNHQD